jgi:hypothetical protein
MTSRAEKFNGLLTRALNAAAGDAILTTEETYKGAI